MTCWTCSPWGPPTSRPQPLSSLSAMPPSPPPGLVCSCGAGAGRRVAVDRANALPWQGPQPRVSHRGQGPLQHCLVLFPVVGSGGGLLRRQHRIAGHPGGVAGPVPAQGRARQHAAAALHPFQQQRAHVGGACGGRCPHSMQLLRCTLSSSNAPVCEVPIRANLLAWPPRASVQCMTTKQ
eukprot:350976-Chlamydomonas_euryale.AAC.1